MQTIVIGHKNPDMDSICSAIAYAELKRKLGMTDVIAARAGNTNERIDLVLNRFGVKAPDFVSDLSPTVADVMERHVISVHHNASIFQAISSLDQTQLRSLPVVDESDRCLGLLSGWKINHYLFPQREAGQLAPREMKASLMDIAHTFDGQFLVGKANDERQPVVIMVAAMRLDSFATRLNSRKPQEVILFVGDREDVQEAAISAGVLGMVITGGVGVSAEVRAAAKETGTYLISSKHDTATTVLLARGAAEVDQMIQPEFTSFAPDTPLRAARQVAANSPDSIFPILTGDKRLVGILSKSDFLKSIPRQVILVDHNELSQAVKGAGELNIVEVLDHHRLSTFNTDVPILFWNNPVGSTSTLVALSFKQYGIKIEPHLAGLLMAGLISDTLNLTSPTATSVDKMVLDELSEIAQTSPSQLANDIFAVGSPLLTLEPKEVIVADCKDYEEDGIKFSVAQIEELGFSHFYKKKDSLLEALESYRTQEGNYFTSLLITDVNTQNSLLLIAAPPQFLPTIHYPNQAPNLYELNNVVSRKKQLVPYLLDCLKKVDTEHS